MRGGPADDGWVATVIAHMTTAVSVVSVAIEDETFDTRADAEAWARSWRRKGYEVRITNHV